MLSRLRPGQVVTHCHPAYMYGGGAMLSGSLEYFGFLNLWVAPRLRLSAPISNASR